MVKFAQSSCLGTEQSPLVELARHVIGRQGAALGVEWTNSIRGVGLLGPQVKPRRLDILAGYSPADLPYDRFRDAGPSCALRSTAKQATSGNVTGVADLDTPCEQIVSFAGTPLPCCHDVALVVAARREPNPGGQKDLDVFNRKSVVARPRRGPVRQAPARGRLCGHARGPKAEVGIPRQRWLPQEAMASTHKKVTVDGWDREDEEEVHLTFRTTLFISTAALLFRRHSGSEGRLSLL